MFRTALINKSLRTRRALATWLAATLLVVLALVSGGAHAGDDDPPGRVGRVTESQGQAWVYDTDADEWVALQRNRPITSGSRIAVDGNARLEFRVGSTTVRLAGASELEVRRLDDERIELFLLDGSAALRVRSQDVSREIEVATPEGRFTPRRTGHYRIDRRDGSSVATAWNGELHFENDDSALNVGAGRSAEFWREANTTRYTWSESQNDEFADWVARANREDDRSGAVTRYVSPEMTGYEDLDRNGHWESHPEYGPVWAPTTVVAGWAPYRYGHWTWMQPLGLDLGRRRAVGLRAVPLWPLGRGGRPLVLGARALCRAAGVCAGAGGLGRPRACQRRCAGGGLGATGPARAVLPALRTGRRLLEVGELGAPALVPDCHAAHHSHTGDPLCQPRRSGRPERGAVDRVGVAPADRACRGADRPDGPQRPQQPAVASPRATARRGANHCRAERQQQRRFQCHAVTCMCVRARRLACARHRVRRSNRRRRRWRESASRFRARCGRRRSRGKRSTGAGAGALRGCCLSCRRPRVRHTAAIAARGAPRADPGTRGRIAVREPQRTPQPPARPEMRAADRARRGNPPRRRALRCPPRRRSAAQPAPAPRAAIPPQPQQPQMQQREAQREVQRGRAARGPRAHPGAAARPGPRADALSRKPRSARQGLSCVRSTGHTLSTMIVCALAVGWMRSSWNKRCGLAVNRPRRPAGTAPARRLRPWPATANIASNSCV